MSYPIPQSPALLLALGNQLNIGLTAEAVSLKITQITPAQLQSTINAFANVNNNYNVARTVRQTASDAFQAQDAALGKWLQAARNVFAAMFGPRWNSDWSQAGFANFSTAIPVKLPDRMSLAGRIIACFRKNTSWQVSQVGVTSTIGAATVAAVTSAQGVLFNAEATLKAILVAWDPAYQALVNMERALIKLLEGSMPANDPRWAEFGLPNPGTPSTPPKPVNLAAEMNESGGIIVSCDATPLATRYRFRMLIVGVDTDYKLAVGSSEPMGVITGVDAGVSVQLIVQAVNGSLQGVASDAIEYTVPVGSKSGEAVKSKGKVVEGEAGDAHGAGNGHAKSGNGRVVERVAVRG